MVIDSKDWSWFNRKRTFFGSLPVSLVRWRVPMRDAPWDAGWEIRAAAPSNHKLPTMMRSRTDHRGLICISTY
eukprot:2154264-Heterocapsa_arctica.AAC.1